MDAILEQLREVPGVVGSMFFGADGAVRSRAFPDRFSAESLRRAAAHLAGDAFLREWMAGEGSVVDLHFGDGRVLLRPVDGAWILVLCSAHANPQLVHMWLTQAIARARGAAAPIPPPPAPAAPPRPGAADQLKAIASAELGGHAARALEILAAAGPSPDDLLRATDEIERLVRLFIDRKKAAALARRMRQIVAAEAP